MKRDDYTFADGPAPALSRPEFDWRDWFAVLLDRVWIVATVLALVMLAGVAHTRRQTPVFQSTARILVEESMPKVLNVEDFISASSRNLDQFNTHVKALNSRTMLQAAVRARGLERALGGGSTNVADAAAAAMALVRIAPVERSRLIDIVAEHTDPSVAAELANGIADQYIAQNAERRVATSTQAFEWLRRQAEDYRRKVEAGRLALHDYRKETQSVSLEEHQDIVVAKLKTINGELTEAESARAMAEAEDRRARAAVPGGAALGQVACIAADPLVQQVQTDLLRKQTEVALLRTRYKDQYPQLAQALSEQRELEALYERTCREAAQRVASRLRMAREKEDGLRQALREQEQQALDLERKLVKYSELKNGVAADQQMYDAILARMKETQIATDMQMNNIRLVDAAKPGRTPARPSWKRNLTNSAMLGLMLGVALVFLAHGVDDRLRRSEEIEHVLGAPVLAVVPRIEKPDPLGRARVVEKDPEAVPAEAFRTLRASLALRQLGREARRIMITSTEAGEGKSLVAANVAEVLAQDGQRTVLVDADLRRPSIHRVFGARETLGLADVLQGTTEWGAAVQETGMDGLSLLCAGALPSNPAELLGSPAMRNLMEGLEARYDRVIVDCPPIFGVSDPLAVLPIMDAVLYVVRFNRAGRRAARRALDKLREGSTPILGIVLNNVNMRRPSSYYYYYHRYGYPRHYARRKPDAR